MGSLDGKVRKRLLSTSQAGAYAPPAAGSEFGHLLFLRESTLMAQPLDHKRWELTGEPFPVAEQVGASLAMGFFAVSSNGVIAYRSGRSTGQCPTGLVRSGRQIPGTAGPACVWRLRFDFSGRETRGDGPGGRHGQSRYLDSGCGPQVVFRRDLPSTRRKTSTRCGRRMARGWRSAPIGTAPAFFDTYQKSSNGSGSEELLIKAGRPEHWSPDGRYILFNLLRSAEMGTTCGWRRSVRAMPSRSPTCRPSSTNGKGSSLQTASGSLTRQTIRETRHSIRCMCSRFPIGGGKFRISTDGGVQPTMGPGRKGTLLYRPGRKADGRECQDVSAIRSRPPESALRSDDPGWWRAVRSLPLRCGSGWEAISGGRSAITEAGNSAPRADHGGAQLECRGRNH